mmetsp:Transcript_127467/g.366659  ORF Transcript_127467/g.366659 Transcript_127467/m.366659 type:complete len:233 (-) Transcript_127467:1825-2523(-)
MSRFLMNSRKHSYNASSCCPLMARPGPRCVATGCGVMARTSCRKCASRASIGVLDERVRLRASPATTVETNAPASFAMVDVAWSTCPSMATKEPAKKSPIIVMNDGNVRLKLCVSKSSNGNGWVITPRDVTHSSWIGDSSTADKSSMRFALTTLARNFRAASNEGWPVSAMRMRVEERPRQRCHSKWPPSVVACNFPSTKLMSTIFTVRPSRMTKVAIEKNVRRKTALAQTK